MKKLILIAIITLSVQYVFAQPAKGQLFIGGSVGANQTSMPSDNSNSSENKRFSINISPNVGYVINDKVALGFSLNYGQYNNKYDNISNSVTSNIKSHGANYGGSLFALYYKPLTEKLFFTLHSSLGYNYGNSKTEIHYNNSITGYYIDLQKSKTNNYALNISPGFEYFLTPRLGLNTSLGSLGYSFISTNNNNGVKENSNSFSLNFFPVRLSDLSIGIRYYFKNSKKE